MCIGSLKYEDLKIEWIVNVTFTTLTVPSSSIPLPTEAGREQRMRQENISNHVSSVCHQASLLLLCLVPYHSESVLFDIMKEQL